jgi:hypothetical protein
MAKNHQKLAKSNQLHRYGELVAFPAQGLNGVVGAIDLGKFFAQAGHPDFDVGLAQCL